MEMRFFWLLVLSGVLAVCPAVQAKKMVIPPPSPIYINLDPLEATDRPPQLDALVFVNRSLFNVQSSQFLLSNPTFFLLSGAGSALYQGQSVLFWTNTGTMIGVPGFKFETANDVRRLTAKQRRKPGAYLTQPAKAFVNEGDITVSTQLSVNSTNIISSGRLEGDLGARISLLAPNGSVDLSRGVIREGRIVSPFAPQGLFFTLDPELTTLYGGTGTNGVYNRTNGVHLVIPGAFTPFPFFSNIIGLTNFFVSGQPQPPLHQVLVNPTLLGRPVTFRITNSLSSVPSCGGGYGSFAEVTDFGLGKSVTVAFVETNSLIETNVAISVRFLGSSTIAVQYESPEFDIIEQTRQTNVVTLIDSGFISPMPPPTNLFTLFPSPFNYQILRGRIAGFDLASPGNTDYSYSLFFNSNSVPDTNITYAYSAASYQIGPTNLTAFNTPVTTTLLTGFNTLGVNPALTDPTNFPSRVEVRAKTLNLNHTRIRAEQVIDIHASNLVDNTFAAVDAPFVSFDVGTTNSHLVITNLAPAVVNRAHGQISAYSATWTTRETNTTIFPGFTNIFGGVTNIFPDITNTVVAPTTYHVLIVGNCLQFSQPTILHRLLLQATNLLLADNLFVNSALKVNSESLTIGSNASLQLPARNSWAFTNVMNVTHFTNFGVLNVPGAGAYFGTVPSGYVFEKSKKKPKKGQVQNTLKPYVDFVNHGVVLATTESFNTELFENTGSFSNPAFLVATNGPLLISAGSVTINNAVLASSENVEIKGGDVSLRSSIVSAGATNFLAGIRRALPGSFVITATNSLGDAGTDFTNKIFVTSGMKLLRRPQTVGDFLATTVYSQGGTFAQALHVWAGEDRGPIPEGYTNNLALGRLVLDGAVGNLFHFKSTTVSNALYVEYLELLNDATNYSFAFGVDPDFTIYFADSNIRPEKLEEKGGGRLRWVNAFAGPQSSTNILYPNGVTYTFNAGLVSSTSLDSDNDGVFNAFDCTPVIPPGLEGQSEFWFGALCPAPSLRSSRATALASPELDLKIALSPGGREVILDWDAPANSANSVEFTESLAGSAEWRSLTNFINGPVNARVTVRDAVDAPQRVYRVRVDAGKP